MGTQVGFAKTLAQAPGRLGDLIDLTQELERRRYRRGLVAPRPRSKQQPWILQQALTDLRGAIHPDRAQLADLAAGQLQARDGAGQTQTVFLVLAGHRHQVTHGSVGWNGPTTNVLLDRERQILDQGQVTRYPAGALVEALG